MVTCNLSSSGLNTVFFYSNGILNPKAIIIIIITISFYMWITLYIKEAKHNCVISSGLSPRDKTGQNINYYFHFTVGKTDEEIRPKATYLVNDGAKTRPQIDLFVYFFLNWSITLYNDVLLSGVQLWISSMYTYIPSL